MRVPSPRTLVGVAPCRRGGDQLAAPAPGRCRSPRGCAPRVRSTRWKRSKMRSSSCGGDADPGVAHARARPDVGRAPRSSTRDRALERELERVRQQIEDDLLPHLAIDVDRRASAGGQSTTSCRPARSIADRNTLARSAVSAARSVGSNVALDASRLDAREVEQRVHELEQAQRVAMNRFQRPPRASASVRRPRSSVLEWGRSSA